MPIPVSTAFRFDSQTEPKSAGDHPYARETLGVDLSCGDARRPIVEALCSPFSELPTPVQG